MSRNVGFSMVPTMSEDDVGDVIEACARSRATTASRRSPTARPERVYRG